MAAHALLGVTLLYRIASWRLLASGVPSTHCTQSSDLSFLFVGCRARRRFSSEPTVPVAVALNDRKFSPPWSLSRLGEPLERRWTVSRRWCGGGPAVVASGAVWAGAGWCRVFVAHDPSRLIPSQTDCDSADRIYRMPNVLAGDFEESWPHPLFINADDPAVCSVVTPIRLVCCALVMGRLPD